ncbi:MAG TPA: YraN family protein [Bacteroidales bacterium]|nr:YraN family protein [Bacteroidales bacterium]
MAEHNKLGKKGEEIAARYLRGLGYKIVEQNWRHKKDEIDLIAFDGSFLVIIEVKTRSTSFFGDPEEAVTDKKRRFLIRATEAYLEKKDLYNEVRYDIISIIIENREERIKHIKDAFYPTLYD